MQIPYKHISLTLLMLISGKSLAMSHTTEQQTKQLDQNDIIEYKKDLVNEFSKGLTHCLRFDNNPNFALRSTRLMQNPEEFVSRAAGEFLNRYPALKSNMGSFCAATLMKTADLVSASKHTMQPLIRDIFFYTLEDPIKEHYASCKGSQKPESKDFIKLASQKNGYAYEQGIINVHSVELHTYIGAQWSCCKFIPGYVSTTANKMRTCTESCISQTQKLHPELSLFSGAIKSIVYQELCKQNISANPEMVDKIYNDVRSKLKTNLLTNVLNHLYTFQQASLEEFIPEYFMPGSANYQQLDVMLDRSPKSNALLVNNLVKGFCETHEYVYGTCCIERDKAELYELLVEKLRSYHANKNRSNSESFALESFMLLKK